MLAIIVLVVESATLLMPAGTVSCLASTVLRMLSILTAGIIRKASNASR